MKKLIDVEDIIRAINYHKRTILKLEREMNIGIQDNILMARIDYRKALLQLDDIIPGFCECRAHQIECLLDEENEVDDQLSARQDKLEGVITYCK